MMFISCSTNEICDTKEAETNNLCCQAFMCLPTYCQSSPLAQAVGSDEGPEDSLLRVSLAYILGTEGSEFSKLLVNVSTGISTAFRVWAIKTN